MSHETQPISLSKVRRKEILIIGPGMEIGGVERSLLGLLDSLDYSTCNVDLFLYAHTGELMPYINPHVNLLPEEAYYSLVNWPIFRLIFRGHFYVATIRLWSKLWGGIRAKRQGTGSVNTALCRKLLTRRIKNLPKKYDIVFSFFQPHYYALQRVRASEKIGWVHTDYSSEYESQDRDFFMPMWKGLDKIACVSESVKKSFDSVYPELKENTIVIENLLPMELIKSQSLEFSATREMPRDGSFRILSIGRFCTAKAFDEAIRAANTLHEKGIDFKWYFIGYGPDEEMLIKLISELKSEDYTIILGKKTNPYPYIVECDLYVQPSRYEGKAVTVTEAQILHKPVMITRYATSASQVEEGVDGYICEMGVEGIVEGLSFLLDHQDIRQKLIAGTMSKKYDNSEEINKIWNLK